MTTTTNGQRHVRRRRVDLIAVVVSCVAGLCAIGALVWSYASHQDDLDTITQSAHVAAYDNRLTALQQCEAGNDSRATTVKFIIDFANEQKLLLLGPQRTPTDPAEKAAAERARKVLASYVRRFENSALHIAESVPPREAQFPKSKDPVARSFRDCDKIYPLPEHRGDDLPNPAIS